MLCRGIHVEVLIVVQVDGVPFGVHCAKPIVVHVRQTAVAKWSIETLVVTVMHLSRVPMTTIVAFHSTDCGIPSSVNRDAHPISIIARNTWILAHVISEDDVRWIFGIASPNCIDIVASVFNVRVLHDRVLHVAMVVNAISTSEHRNKVRDLYIFRCTAILSLGDPNGKLTPMGVFQIAPTRWQEQIVEPDAIDDHVLYTLSISNEQTIVSTAMVVAMIAFTDPTKTWPITEARGNTTRSLKDAATTQVSIIIRSRRVLSLKINVLDNGIGM